MNRWIATAAVALVAVMVLGGCAETNKEKEPWVSGDRLEKERSRSDAQLEELRNRLARSQTDR